MITKQQDAHVVGPVAGEATLRDWQNRIHDNELSIGDRLQGLSCQISMLLSGEPEGQYKPYVIREQAMTMHVGMPEHWVGVMDALIACKEKFAFYAHHHRAKGGEADEKAMVNEGMVAMLETVIASATTSPAALDGPSSMCERKSADIIQRDGYKKTGYVLMHDDPAARICVSDGGAVSWFTREQWQWLIHNRDHTTFEWPKPIGWVETAQPATAASIESNAFHKVVMDMRNAYGAWPQDKYRALVAFINIWATQLVAAETQRCSEILRARERSFATQLDAELAAQLSQPRASLSDEQIMRIAGDIKHRNANVWPGDVAFARAIIAAQEAA